MERIAKRGLSLLMALVLLFSLLPGIPLTASAASYSYNWGYRGVTATYLSSAAQNFYANNGTSYEELSSYEGSATLSSVPSSKLYDVLQTLMTENHDYKNNYEASKSMFQYTDCQGGGGKISSFYSGKEIGPAWDNGSTWNREHTWPNSKGLAGYDEHDIMMLRPTATSENSSRGNKAYGISSGYYDPNSESGGSLNLHGDVARIFLYVYVRWGNVNGNGQYTTWGTSGVMESKEVLLAWMEEDPVDTWELGRNDVVQGITGTRNVFVDYPELAFLLFGEEIPDTMATPSGMAIAGAHDITVTSNDTSMGTVSRSGKTVTAVPAVGYKVDGYEVLSGTAEVTQDGNTFTVNASSDCEIQINFAAKALVDLIYLDNGETISSSQVYDEDPVMLSAYTGTAPEGYTFVGWVDAPVSRTETVPTYYEAGTSYTINGATTMYALFSCVFTDDEGSSTVYTTSTCAHGDTVDVAGKAADCANSGYTDGVYCNDCESYISGHETIGALGHSYSSVVTEPTVTEAGYTTHTCGRCGDVYTSDPVPALGETYTVSFSVPVDAGTVESMGCNTRGILLPEAAALEGYTFQGWTTAPVADSAEKPVVYAAGEKFVASETMTLYALYSYGVGGSGEAGYVLATSADQLAVGDNVIIASSAYDYAMSTSQGTSGNNRGQVAVTKNADGTLTFDASAGVAVMELQAGTVDGTYAFYCPVNAAYLYASSTSSNHLKLQTTPDANGSFLIEFGESGVCSITAQGDNTRNSLRHNSGSSIFSCYLSTNSQSLPCIYVETVLGETYYTTEIAHRHSGTYHAAAEATCQNDGNVEYWSCGCGVNFSDSSCTEVIADVTVGKLDHSFTAELAEEKYLVSEANCQAAAVYAVSCDSCGTASDTEVFSYGEKNSENHVSNGYTCTDNGDGTHKKVHSCCEAVADEAETHSFDENNVCACGKTASAMIGDAFCGSIEEALEAAEAGDVVELVNDVTVTKLILPEGVSLDLGSSTLTADYFYATKDSEVYADPDSGKLIVPKGQLVLGEEGYRNEKGQYILPVWDPEQNCYIFSQIVVNTDSAKGRGLTVDEENGKICFRFKHQATGSVNSRLFSDGASDNEVSVILRLEWTGENGTVWQDFSYSDIHIGKVTGSYDYTFALTGYSALNIDLSTLTVTARIKTGSTATAFGESWTAETAE